jgi:MFS family permease
VPLSEPTTLVSDWVLAAVAVALGVRLYRAGAGQDGRARRLWAAAFLAGAAAALAGGAVHGFAASLTPVAHAVLWKTVLVGIGLAGSLILAGTVLATLTGGWRTAFLAGAAGQLAVYLALVSGSDDVRLAVWNGAVTILALLALAPATASHAPRCLAWILLALGLMAAALAVQRSGLAAGLLNHNDICHVLQTAALWPFYRAGLLLHDRGRQAAGPGVLPGA